MNDLVKNNLLNIGGDFELNFEDKYLLNKSKKKFKENYKKKYNYYTDCGRSAIYLALKILKKKNNNLKALLPFYCCPSIIQPFNESGIKIVFYSMGVDLNTPNNLPQYNDNTVLLFIHYFGKKNKSMLKFINTQKKVSKNFYIIEDLVQTCMSKINKNYVGDFLISSFRKFLPVPDGAILATDYKYHGDFLITDFDYLSKKILSKELRKNSDYEKLYLDLHYQTEIMLDRKIKLRKISLFSELIYKKLNIDYIQKKRIFNWKKLNFLLKKNNKHIRCFYSNIDNYEVPLAYPVLISPKKRGKFLNYLKKYRIYCAIHWNLNYKKIDKVFYDDYKISKSIISIPIDHRLDVIKLNNLVRIINEFS